MRERDPSDHFIRVWEFAIHRPFDAIDALDATDRAFVEAEISGVLNHAYPHPDAIVVASMRAFHEDRCPLIDRVNLDDDIAAEFLGEQ